ncbi:tetratricopeptide repeat protein [Mongoliibacter sp.]|uniref:tetratricopeptide repeat protein n=1 Tax=Mongoliibacter sp. TaxID=2022438 RepID=UPI0025E92549|nr:tetratricopeptide repeat protein [Mongoliibacter sp.]
MSQSSFKNQNPEYKRILDETDDFGSDYLNVMEYGVSKIRDDILRLMAMAYSDMSNLFWKLGKYVKGVEYGKKPIVLFEDRGIFDVDFDFTFHVLGNNLLELKRHDEALCYFQRSIAISEKYKFYKNLSDSYMPLANFIDRLKTIR